MTSPRCQSRNPDIIASFAALKRAAKAARKLSIETGTPFYVMKDGKIVDLNRDLQRKKPVRRVSRQEAAMKPVRFESRDPDIRASFAALKRAAKAARKLSIETGTPFYVMKDGKIVDLNRGMKRKRTRHG